MTFYNQAIQVVALPSLRILESWPLPYRDDNRYLWDFDENRLVDASTDYLPPPNSRSGAMSAS